MFRTVVETIEKRHISIREWIVSFMAIVFVRFFLEAFSSKSSPGISFSISALVHFYLFFLVASLGIMCIVHLFTHTGKTVAILTLLALPITWVAPIVDILVTRGKGMVMGYMYNGPVALLHDFLTFFGSHFSGGVTVGMRFEIILFLVGIGWYMWNTTHKKITVLWATLSSYTFIFCTLALPSLAYFLFKSVSVLQVSMADFFLRAITQSTITYNTLNTGVVYASREIMLASGFDKLMSEILFIIACVLTIVWFWNVFPKTCKAILKNSRLERVLHYLVLVFLGVLYAYVSGRGAFSSWVDWLGFISVSLSFYAAWMYAVHVNDVSDVQIDAISNPNRPILQNDISAFDMSDSSFIWLCIALLGAFVASTMSFFMVLVFIVCYYIYSVDTLRLKRIPILSSFLVSLACLSSVLGGFFFISHDKALDTFPLRIALGIIVIFTLGSNIRDLKDIAGDTADSISTIPVLFKRHGKKIVGILLAISFFLVPLFLSVPRLYMLALLAGVLGYVFVTRKNYKEKYIFILYFLFIFFAVTLYLF